MCGIAGQLNFDGTTPVDPAVIRLMAQSIAHRGPDDEGYLTAGPVGLGFRRLSIIDLAGGHQPMADEAGTVFVVFNGEIYNFKELRAELEGRGHRFRTRSDTEVIVLGYKEWGTGVFDRLNGMFGLAIWDARSRRLVVARDAMGIKPVYYSNSRGRLTFASEIRALTAADGRAPQVDPVALSSFLKFRYTPAPATIFRDIRKLAPGTMLVAENGTCREERWYDYTPVPFSAATDEAEAEEELLRLYKGAVQRHLLSDVPVGILLSGGLDSGLLLALMNEHGDGWPAYTVGYGEGFADDELADAAQTAALLGARHVSVRLDRAEFERSLPQIVGCLEEPITTASIVPMYFVCQRAREDVKVALIGQGPDELFGGYKRHLGLRYGDRWRALPGMIQRAIASGINRLPRNETAKRGVYSLGVRDRLSRYQHVFSLAPAGIIDGLFRPGLLPGNNGEKPIVEYWASLLPQMAHLDELGGFQHLEIRSSLPDELLMFGDKLSMAHALEVRVPYLDRTVVEFAQRLNARMKIRRLTGKWIHRRVCQHYLPPAILRRKKRAFATNVVDGWFDASVQGMMPEVLLNDDSLMFSLLAPQPVRRLLDEHRNGRHDHHKLLFSLVMFEQWLREIGSVSASRAPSRPSVVRPIAPNHQAAVERPLPTIA
jgi:asparagine synthase (glutamine-hydrolysing)